MTSGNAAWSGARIAALVLATVTSSACTGDARPSTTAVVDSAGVRIVTNLPGSIESAVAWSLPAQPVVDIGSGVSPDVPLYRVTAVVPLDGSRVAVGMDTPPQALVFEPGGTLAATLGRQGEGPGEFATVTSVVQLAGDSLAVWDQNRRRVSVFMDGRYVRDVDLSALALLSPLAAGSLDTPSAWSQLLPSTAGSLVLLQVRIGGEPAPGAFRMEAPSYRLTTDGEEQARFGPFPGEELYNLGVGLGGIYSYPFGADTYGATAADAFVVGTAETPEFRLYGHSGALERIVRWADQDRTVGGRLLAEWSEIREAWFASMSADQRVVIGDFLNRMPHPERFPAYDGIVTSDVGEIWIGEYAGPLEMPYPPLHVRAPVRRWLVFDIDGALVATVHTPEGFQPYAVREERIWGVYTDELDIESIRAYAITRACCS